MYVYTFCRETAISIKSLWLRLSSVHASSKNRLKPLQTFPGQTTNQLCYIFKKVINLNVNFIHYLCCSVRIKLGQNVITCTIQYSCVGKYQLARAFFVCILYNYLGYVESSLNQA